MKNESLFKRAKQIERFQTAVDSRESDYDISEADWTDAFAMHELTYILGLYLDGSTCYQDTLRYGNADERRLIRSEISKLRRLIAAYKKQGTKPTSMSVALGF